MSLPSELRSLGKSLLLALVLSLGVSFAYAQFGPDPGTVAPNNNVPAPVNVGTEAQVKAGPLGVTAFTADSIQMNGQTLRLSGGSETSYGAATVRGSKNGWSGLNFKDAAGTNYGTLMMHPSYSGFYNTADNEWRWYVDNAGNQYGSGGLLLRDAGGGWMRTYGNTGWYNGTYGGGWYMADPTWISAYGNKYVYTGGVIRGDGGLQGPSFTDINNGGYYVDPAGVSSLSTVYSSINYDQNNPGYYTDPNGTSRMGTIYADNINANGVCGSGYCGTPNTSSAGGWNFYQSSPGGTPLYLYGKGVIKDGLFSGTIMCNSASIAYPSNTCGYGSTIDCSPGSYYAIYHGGSQDYCAWLYSQYYRNQVDVRGLSVYAISRIW